MHVAGALLDRLEHERVDELDERTGGFILRGLDFLFVRKLFALVAAVATHRIELTPEIAELQLDVLSRSDPEHDLASRRDAQLVDGLNIGRIGDRDQQPLAVERVRHGAGTDKRPRFNRVGRVSHNTEGAQVYEGKIESLGNLTRYGDAGRTSANAGRGHAPRMSWTRVASS
jgi:hypothetical protein